MKRFRVRFKHLHDQTGLTAYAVAKETGLVENTVRKFVTSDDLVLDYIYNHVLVLAEFYGVDWREVVEEVDVEDPEFETPLLNAV